MNQVPLWVSYLQALATPAIAALAAAIAYGQWRIAKQKLVQDLFDRRFAVFIDVRLIVNDVVQDGVPVEPSLAQEALTRARFLFGDDLCEEIEKIRIALTDVEFSHTSTLPDNNRNSVQQSFRRLLPIFESYMRFDHRAP